MAENIQCCFQRYEKKYILSRAQQEYIMKIMRAHMVPDEYGQYTICSVYYDTPDWRLIRGERAGEVGCHPGSGDDRAEAALAGRVGKGARLPRRPVGGINVHLVGHAEFFEHVRGFFHHGHIARAAHYDPDLFHKKFSL